MQVRIQPKSLADAVHGLKDAFEEASGAASALCDQARRLTSSVEPLATTRRECAAHVVKGFAEIGAGTKRVTAEVAEANAEITERSADINQLKDATLVALAKHARELLGFVEASGAATDRSLGEFGLKFDEIGLLAERRRHEMLRHFEGTAEFFNLFERGGSEFQKELGNLKKHLAEQAGFRTHRELSRRRAKAVSVTDAGIRALQAGGVQQAQARFREAYDLCPTPMALFNLALALILAGKADESRQLLSTACLGQCDPVEVQALKSLQGLQAKDHAQALREAEAGLHIRPEHPVLRKLAATAALAANSAATAVRYLSPTEAAMLKMGFVEPSHQ